MLVSFAAVLLQLLTPPRSGLEHFVHISHRCFGPCCTFYLAAIVTELFNPPIFLFWIHFQMYIASAETGKSILWNYKLEAAQKVAETIAYIVVEHGPVLCKQFPPNGNVTFTNIKVEVANKAVASPVWIPMEQTVACHSKVDPPPRPPSPSMSSHPIPIHAHARCTTRTNRDRVRVFLHKLILTPSGCSLAPQATVIDPHTVAIEWVA